MTSKPVSLILKLNMRGKIFLIQCNFSCSYRTKSSLFACTYKFVYNKNMSLNCNEIDLILKELNIEGYLVQDIIQPGFDTLALYLYANANPKTLLICTAPNSCRINETTRKITKNEKPLRFMELLKSKIRGARIKSCKQIENQRIIEIRLSHADENFILYIRLWSGAANVILCTDDGTILDSMYRRPNKGEITGQKFFVQENSFKNTSNSTQKIWPIRTFDEIQEEFSKKHPDSPKLTFNQKVDIWYGEHAQNLSREALLIQAEKWYNSTKSRMLCALERLEKKQKDFENAEKIRHHADLILSNGANIPQNSKFLECIDYENGKNVRILIDPKKNAQENAAVYYENYKKAKSGIKSLTHDIEISKIKLNKLEKLYTEILNEKNPVKIEQLLRKDSKPEQQKKKTHPGLDYTVNGWYILVGRDANENDELLRHHVRGSDTWLHVRDFPGGYVFIKARAGKTVPLEILLDAANLAVYYSKARNNAKVDLYYTQVKYLRRAKNGPKGLVLPSNEKNLCVTPDSERLAKLDSIRAEY